MIWLPRQFPELAHLDTDQRAAVLRRIPIWTIPMMIIRAGVGGFIWACLAFAGGAMFYSQVTGTFAMDRSAEDMVVLTAFFVLAGGGILSYLRQLKHIRAEMRAEIAEGFRG